MLYAGLSVMERRLALNGNHHLPAISPQQGTVRGLLQQGKTVKEIAFQLQLGETRKSIALRRCPRGARSFFIGFFLMHPGRRAS